MKNLKHKYLFILFAILPLLLFVLPLWVISMDAPQFPEGLEMNIFINSVEGNEDHGLESINSLNHYIGMKKIEPDSIKELEFIPYIVIIMAILGVIVALINKRIIFIAWISLYSILGAIGMYDFYLWETDFGTNLDPKAIIKADGMTYQPPLIGTKEIMNFTVTSLPGSGGWILFGTIFAGWASIFFADKKNKIVQVAESNNEN